MVIANSFLKVLFFVNAFEIICYQFKRFYHEYDTFSLSTKYTKVCQIAEEIHRTKEIMNF